MILNDPEWLEWPFYVNFHYYELPLRVIIYLFTVESVYILYIRDQRRCAEAE